jgi:N-acetylmuramoyl-L-alanine amidase
VLVEASWSLGDRVLYHRSPNLRGDDVAELQHRLGRLGFDAGRVDGIFGPLAAAALEEFQRNAGLPADGVCGASTVHALRRLGDRTADGPSVAAVREEERLRRSARSLVGRRVVVGQFGGLGILTRSVARLLRTSGGVVLVTDEPDQAVHAAAANRFGADVYVGVRGADAPGPVAYYRTAGFESSGGHRLADLMVENLGASVVGDAVGLRLPVLRETKMPAVLSEVGPVRAVLDRAPLIANALVNALDAWVRDPLPASGSPA